VADTYSSQRPGKSVNRTKGRAKEAQIHHVFSMFAKVSAIFAKVLAGGTKISHACEGVFPLRALSHSLLKKPLGA